MLAAIGGKLKCRMTDTTNDNEGSELSPIALRVKALESLLVEKGYVDPAALDVLIETYETKIGPRNGARVVAKAWIDPAYASMARTRMQPRPSPRLGFTGRQGEHMVALFNTPETSQHGRLHAVLLLPVAGAWACRRSGTSRRPIARAPSSIRAACSPNSA